MSKGILTRIQRELQIILREKSLANSAILVVYIFGSSVAGEERINSDLDLAFLLDEKAYKADPVSAVAPSYLAATKVGMKLERETDVTVLNAASLEMAYEVVTTGICLFEADLEKRLEYEAVLRGMYFDFKPFLDDIRSSCISDL